MLLLAFASLVATAGFTVETLDPPTSLEGAGWQCAPVVDGKPTAFAPVTLPQPPGDKACNAPAVELRTVVDVPPALRGGPLGVAVGEIKGAYDVRVNDVIIGGLGSFDPLVDALRVGAAFPIPKHVVDENGHLAVAVRIVRDGDALKSTQDFRAVTAGPLFIGQMPAADARAAAIVDAHVRDDIGASLAIGLLFAFVAIYHFLVWLMRRDLRGYLWFGVFAALADAWISSVQIAGTPALPITLHTEGIVGNLIGANVNTSFIEFFFWYLTKKPPPRAWRIYQAALIAASLVGFIPNVGVAWSVSIPVIILKVAVPALAAVELLRKERRRTREARVLIIAVVIGALAAPLIAWLQTTGIRTTINLGQGVLAAMFLTMAVALADQFARSMRDAEKRAKELAETNASIARFVPHTFLRALDKESVREVNRGDATATTMSVMFCDLRGFTTLAEKMGPKETFAFINDYLARMEPEIIRAGGFINQYLGDGIMALFPSSPTKSSADAAVDAASAMARAVEKLNAERTAKALDPLRIGIGIHTGPLMLGTIGGGDQLDSGVVGDTVNTAARLEGITKMYGAAVLLSGATMQALSDPARRGLRPLDAVKAKGKSEPLVLVELLDADAKPLRDQKLATRGELEAALGAYRKGKFDEAAALFDAVAAKVPADGAARALADRSRAFVSEPPASWDGVLALQTK